MKARQPLKNSKFRLPTARRTALRARSLRAGSRNMTAAQAKRASFLAYDTEHFDLAGKRKRAATEGVAAWVNPEEYRRYVAAAKRRFEDQVDKELGATPPAR
jgi:hypothetical protein